MIRQGDTPALAGLRARPAWVVFGTVLLLTAIRAGAADIQDYYFKKSAVRVLILSGRNNHDWRASTPFLQTILEQTGRFDVRVEEEPNSPCLKSKKHIALEMF